MKKTALEEMQYWRGLGKLLCVQEVKDKKKNMLIPYSI